MIWYVIFADGGGDGEGWREDSMGRLKACGKHADGCNE